MQVGLITFDRNATEQVAPTQDRYQVRAGLARAQLGPGTAIGEAVFLGLQAVAAATSGAAQGPAAGRKVLLSDGGKNGGRTTLEAATATAARAARIPVSTSAFRTPDGTVTIGGQTIPVPADYGALRALANDSGGRPLRRREPGPATQRLP